MPAPGLAGPARDCDTETRHLHCDLGRSRVGSDLHSLLPFSHRRAPRGGPGRGPVGVAKSLVCTRDSDLAKRRPAVMTLHVHPAASATKDPRTDRRHGARPGRADSGRRPMTHDPDTLPTLMKQDRGVAQREWDAHGGAADPQKDLMLRPLDRKKLHRLPRV